MENKFIIPLLVIMLVMIAGFGIMFFQIKINNSQMLMSMQAYVNTIRDFALSSGGNSKASEVDPNISINTNNVTPEYTVDLSNNGGFCNDSDGGNFPDVTGEVLFAPNNYTIPFIFRDECIGSSTMIENVCVNGFPVAIPFECPASCEGTKCVGDACIDTDGGVFLETPGRAYIRTANGTVIPSTDKCEMTNTLGKKYAFVTEAYCEYDPILEKMIVKKKTEMCDIGKICKAVTDGPYYQGYCDFE